MDGKTKFLPVKHALRSNYCVMKRTSNLNLKISQLNPHPDINKSPLSKLSSVIVIGLQPATHRIQFSVLLIIDI